MTRDSAAKTQPSAPQKDSHIPFSRSSMALNPPLTLTLQRRECFNGVYLFRCPASHSRSTLCLFCADEDGGSDDRKGSNHERSESVGSSDPQSMASLFQERLYLTQNAAKQWWFWLPSFPRLPSMKEEFIVLAADAVSKCFTWDGWGTSLCWWANFAGGLQSGDKDRLLDLLFDMDKGLGLNIVRYNIGGGANPALNEYLRPFGHVPGFKRGPYAFYNWKADARQQSILLGARDRGANVFEAFSNSPPHWMTMSGSVTGNTRWGQDNLSLEYEEAFADYLTEVVKYYRDHFGLHFDFIAPFNEPVEGWWNINRKKITAQEGCNFSISSMNRFIPKLKKALVKKKLQTKITAFDAWSQNTVRVLLGMDEDTLSVIDQINVHTYVFITSREDYAKRKQVREACESVSKRLWMSEYGPLNWRGEDMDVALGLGRHIALDVNELQASAWCYWQALEMRGSLWGLLQTSFTYDTEKPMNLTISKQYYVFMQFSKWVRPGFQIFPVDKYTDRILVSASLAAKLIVLVFINDSMSFRDYSFDVSVIAPWLATDCKMDGILYRTSATENFERLPSCVFDFPSVLIRVVSRSVTTLVLSEAAP